MKKIVFALCSVLFLGIQLLTAVPPSVSAAGENLVANASVETAANATTPQSWTSSKWGTNTTQFSYPSTGFTGTRSVRAQMTSYTDGDAKWFFNPVTVTPGKTYTFSDYYQSNTPTEVVVRYTHAGGTFSYAWLGTANTSSAWAQTSNDFTVPTTATQATVFHLISSVGWLVLDDASVKEVPPPTQSNNLIGNPSVETSNGTAPASWVSNKWGTNNASLTYPTTGHTGSRSVRTQITSYTDGDAKWYFNPVDVTPGISYEFSDYYQSSVATQVIARYTNGSGTFSYEWLGSVPASSAWQQAAFSFTPPAGTTRATVFHIVSSVGWLVIDDASLVQETSANPVPNPSVEEVAQGNPNMPDQWTTNAWGANTSAFAYANEGHTGVRSIRATISNYTDGDAKWMYTPQALTPGETYAFSAWYKTNTTPHVAAMHQLSNGTTVYNNLPDAFPPASAATQWQQFKDTFTVPPNAESTSLFFYIANNGWVQTDDYAIEAYEPVGFTRPLVTLTFDDGEEDNVTTALPVMNTRGFKSTQCFATNHVEGDAENTANVLAFKNSGHEICSHTVNHPFLTQISATEANFELSHSQDFLETLAGTGLVRNFASPYGDYNAQVVANIQQYYRSHRTVDEGYNSKDNFNMYRVRVQNMLSSTTLAQYQEWLDHAEATNTWLVLVYHRIAPSNPGPFDTPQADFAQQMQALDDSNLTVKTYNDALDEVVPQL